MNFKDTVKAGYDKIAGRYLAERARDSEDVHLLDDLIVRLPRQARVLDAGCGAGVPVTQILSQHFNVIGVDFSSEQIELAKKHVPNAKFFCQDMTQLDFPVETFDAICSYYAIIHIPRQEQQPLFVNFHRMLKPGGYALLCLGAENLVDDIDEDFLGTPMYWSHFDSQTYLNMLQDAGFTTVWSRRVADAGDEGASHLFVLVQKPSL